MRLKLPKDEFLNALEEFKRVYEEISGKKISYEEVLDVLEGKKVLFPVTERIARLLEELGRIYYTAPWEVRRWVSEPPERDKTQN